MSSVALQPLEPIAQPQPQEEEITCSICLEAEKVGLRGRIVPLPCSAEHIAHLSCFIRVYSGANNPTRCPLCRNEGYDILVPTTFAHLQPDSASEAVHERYARIQRVFGYAQGGDLLFTRKPATEQKKELSKLYWHDDTLFDGVAPERTEKRAVQDRVGNPWAILDSERKNSALRNLYTRGMYAEKLENRDHPETEKSFHNRQVFFAENLIRTNPVARAAMLEVVGRDAAAHRPASAPVAPTPAAAPAAIRRAALPAAPDHVRSPAPAAVAPAPPDDVDDRGCCESIYDCFCGFIDSCIETGMWIYGILYCLLMALFIYLTRSNSDY